MKKEANNTKRVMRFVDRSSHTKKLNEYAKWSLVRSIECYSNVPTGKIIEKNEDMRGIAIIAGCHEKLRQECDRDKSCTLFGIENAVAEYKKCRKVRLTVSEI